MGKLSSVYTRFTFGYMYNGDSELYFSPFHYNTYFEASNALEEFLRVCSLDGDDVSFSSVMFFNINIVRFAVPDLSKD